VRALAQLPRVRLAGVSPLYLTRPVGVTDQPAFHNAVVALDAPRGPSAEAGAMALLVALKGLERAFGRRRRRRWGPRELDLDLLIYGRHRLHVPREAAARSAGAGRGRGQWLDVPHVAGRERLFVLAPLADLAPRLVPAGWHLTVQRARAERETIEGADAVRRVATWDGPAGRWVPTPEPWAAPAHRRGPPAGAL
jgi:2-amino-4-hydroxy-6-hydroxymethyldihydropteridine diphosphokinase